MQDLLQGTPLPTRGPLSPLGPRLRPALFHCFSPVFATVSRRRHRCEGVDKPGHACVASDQAGGLCSGPEREVAREREQGREGERVEKQKQKVRVERCVDFCHCQRKIKRVRAL